MRIKTSKTDNYCENCSNLAITVETETETHIYCDNCTKYVIIDKNDVESQKCC
jgi:hypothetical protein